MGDNYKDIGLISVIIPIYNGERYIGACIDSILTQEYKNIELILVNDGSKDSTADILYKYQDQDQRVRVIEQRNSGVSVARNKGLDSAYGKWIAFIDADDWVDGVYFSKPISMAEGVYYDVIGWSIANEYEDQTVVNHFFEKKSSYMTYDDMNEFRVRSFTGYSKTGISEKGIRNVYARIIRHDIIKKHKLRFIEALRHHEDVIFMLNVYEEANSVLILDEGLYHRRMRGDSTIHGFEENIIDMNELASREFFKIYEVHSKDVAYKNALVSMHIWWLTRTFDLYLFHDKSPLKFMEKVRKTRRLLNSEQYMKVLDFSRLRLGVKKRLLFVLMKYKQSFILCGLYKIYM